MHQYASVHQQDPRPDVFAFCMSRWWFLACCCQLRSQRTCIAWLDHRCGGHVLGVLIFRFLCVSSKTPGRASPRPAALLSLPLPLWWPYAAGRPLCILLLAFYEMKRSTILKRVERDPQSELLVFHSVSICMSKVAWLFPVQKLFIFISWAWMIEDDWTVASATVQTMAFSTLLQLMAPPKCGWQESVKISAKRIEQSKMVLFIHGKHMQTWIHVQYLETHTQCGRVSSEVSRDAANPKRDRRD